MRKYKLANDYDLHMGGVDKKDVIIGNYSSLKNPHMWTTKVDLHSFEETIVNAFVLYRKCGGGVCFVILSYQ